MSTCGTTISHRKRVCDRPAHFEVTTSCTKGHEERTKMCRQHMIEACEQRLECSACKNVSQAETATVEHLKRL